MSNVEPKTVQAACESCTDKIDIPVEHFWSDGMYGRMMLMPQGSVLVGKTHKHNHLAILLAGEVQVVSKYGTACYKAPYVVNVLAGDKRAFHALTPVKWITVHATETKNLDQLELELVEGDSK